MTVLGQLEPGYSIDFDRPNRLMRIAVYGFWNAQTVAALADAVAWLAEPQHPTTD